MPGHLQQRHRDTTRGHRRHCPSLVTIIVNCAFNGAYLILGWNCQDYCRISPEIEIFSVRLLVSKSLVLIREMNYATSSSTEPCSPTDLFRTFFVLVYLILHCNIKNSLLQRTLSIVPIFRNGNQVFPVVQQLHLLVKSHSYHHRGE